MADSKPQRPVFRYHDRPELTETFADHVGRCTFDGNTLRIDFAVSRIDERRASEPGKASEAPTGTRYPVCRLVLTVAAALELLTQCGQLAAALEKAGVVKKVGEDRPAKTN